VKIRLAARERPRIGQFANHAESENVSETRGHARLPVRSQIRAL
jgi:hypothetical protein